MHVTVVVEDTVATAGVQCRVYTKRADKMNRDDSVSVSSLLVLICNFF